MLMIYLLEYLTADGRSPFNDWLLGLKDIRVRARIRAKLDRVSLGNFGDYASVGGGVFELRMFFGPGYRVYFSLEEDQVVLLLHGGTKASQQRDIRKAKSLMTDYRKRDNGN